MRAANARPAIRRVFEPRERVWVPHADSPEKDELLSQPLRRSAEMTVGNECRADAGETLLLRGSPPADRE